jgi:hypothetical protein
MVRRKLNALIAAAVIATLAALGGCSNPNAFMSAVKDEAKSALGMYLVVSSISPANNTAGVDPSAIIQINFDRSLDTSTALAYIFIAPSSAPATYVPWTYAYDDTLKRLSITPAALDGNATYIVTIKKGIAGSSGEPLKDDYTWNFTTADLPGGSVHIDNTGDIYSTSRSVTLHYSWNMKATRYSYSEDPSYFNGTPSFIANVLSQSYTFTPGADGTRTIYVQFADAGTTKSTVVSASIIVDTNPPSAPTILTSPTSPDTTTHYPIGWTWAGGGGGCGIFKYSTDGGATWSAESSSTGLIFADGLANGTYNFRVKERDLAGNWSPIAGATLVLNAPPIAPIVTGPATPCVDATPTWSWTSGGFGNGNFLYQLDSTSGSWTGPVAAGSYTPSALSTGSHTLYVTESDSNGNVSGFGSKSLYITPVIPINGATGVSTLPTLSWRGSGLRGTSYSIQFYSGEAWTTVATTTVPSYTFTTALSLLTTYTWRVVYTSLGTVYVPTSAGATFTTRGFIIKL